MTTNKIGLPKDHISFTQISDYMACPKYYYLKYHENKRPVESFALRFGSFQHAVAARINERIIANKKDDLSFEDVAEIYDAEFKDGKYHFSASEYATGKENLRAYALQTVAEKSLILHAEYEIKYKMESGAVIVARLDRVDVPAPGALEIIDFKSSALIPSTDELLHDAQLRIYAFLIWNLYPETESIFIARQTFQSRVDAETGEVRGGFKKKAQIDIAGLPAVGEYLQIIWDRISEAKQWPCNPDITGHCEYCPEKCDDYRRIIAEKYDDLKVNDIVSVARRFIQLSNQKSAVEKQHKDVKALVEKHFDENLKKDIAIDDKMIFLSYHSKKAELQPRAGYDFTKITIGKNLSAASALESLKDLKGKVKKSGKK